MRFFLLGLASVLCAIAAVMLVAQTPTAAERPLAQPRSGADLPTIGDSPAWTLVGAVQQNNRRALIDELLRQQRERAEAAAAAARAKQSYRRSTGGSSSGGTITGSCAAMKPAGFPDYIIQRESGGDPTAHNPSGAYGCAQLMPMHLTGDYQGDWARLWNNGAGACNWTPPNYCAGR